MTIPYARQSISDDDIRAVVEVLKSEFLTQGPAVPEFERAIAAEVGAEYAIATNSATSALHLACLALGLSARDRLWTSPITFVASANCALYCGAEVDFVDIDPDTFNIGIDALELKLQRAEEQGTLPKIVVPVHFGGLPCDMAAIGRLAKRYGFFVIEDASHALGGRYQECPVGDCRYSDITVFSFHPVKIITTGEGGIAVTNDFELARKIALLRSHGITRDAEQMTHAPDGPWYYQQIELGFNYRMNDIEAALGSSQLKRLHAFVARRHELATLYRRYLSDLPVRWQRQPDDCYSAIHLFVIRLRSESIERPHADMFQRLRSAGIGINLHYIPVHLQPYYQNKGFKRGDFPKAESYYREAISLPMYPDLSERQIEQVCGVLKESLFS